MGSLGSKTVNDKIVTFLNDFKNKEYQVLFVTGNSYYESVKNLKVPSNVIIKPFIYELPALMKVSDLIITRAGASTMSEILVLGLPAIFIPSPYVTNNHQYKNAAVLAKAGAAVLVAEKELSSERIVSEVRTLVENTQKRAELEARIRNFADADTSKCVFRELVHLVGDNRLCLSEEDEKALGEAVAVL